MKAVVAAFNQEKALVGAFSVITNLRMELFGALGDTVHQEQEQQQEQEQEVQRVTLRAGSLLESETAGGAASGSGWRISPIPWRMLLPPDPDQVLCSTHIQRRLV